ncbi:hypothetical protein ACX80O_08230 [Arthrobacter sp. Hz1]
MAGLVGLVLGASGCGGMVSAPPSASNGSAAPSPAGGSPATAASPVIIYLEPQFRGSESAELSEINHQVQTYLLDYPTVFSGAYYSEDRSVLTIGVALPEDPAVAGLETLLQKTDPAGTLTESVPVDYSWAELDIAKMEIVQRYMMTGPEDIVSVGLDTSVLVTVFRQAADVPPTENQTAIEIAQQYGPMVKFRESSSTAAISGS